MTRMLRLVPRTEGFLSFLPEIDLVGRVFGSLEFPELFGKERVVVPDFDVAETEKEYTITGEVPGMDVKDLDVTLTDGILTVTGEKRQEREDDGEHYHWVERHYGSFRRSFRIPDDVEAEKSTAAYKDGVLKLTLPKAKVVKSKRVEVKGKKPRTRAKRKPKAH